MRKGRDVSVTLPGVYVVHQNMPGRVVRRYERAEHVLFVPIRGEIEVKVDSRVLHCGPGRLVYLPPRTVHALRCSDRGGERLIALVEEGAWEAGGGARLSPVSVPTGPWVRDTLLHLLLNPDTRAAQRLLEALVAILSESCCRREPGADLDQLEGLAQDPRLCAALAHLRAHLADSLTISDVAEAAGASVRTLNRLFVRELGMTPKAAVVWNRMEIARQSLAMGGTSVTEAALAAGYRSMSQFVAAFRKATGQLPSEFARGVRRQGTDTRRTAEQRPQRTS